MGGDIMGPGPNENNETRIIYDEGPKRLVFFARELNIKTVASLEAALNKSGTPENPLAAKTIFSKDSVVGVLVTPQKLDSSKSAIWAKTLYVQNPDGILSRVDAYLNPAAFVEKERFQQIIQKVFGSYRQGERRLNLAAHADSFAIMGGKSIVKYNLPDNYLLSKDRGEDFEVYHIELATAFGEKEQSSIIIYFGFNPSLFNKEFELTNFRKPDTEEELMFHKGNWENYFDPRRSLYLREQLFDDDEIETGMKIHIAILSNEQKRVDELSAIVKNLLIVYDPAHIK